MPKHFQSISRPEPPKWKPKLVENNTPESLTSEWIRDELFSLLADSKRGFEDPRHFGLPALSVRLGTLKELKDYLEYDDSSLEKEINIIEEEVKYLEILISESEPLNG